MSCHAWLHKSSGHANSGPPLSRSLVLDYFLNIWLQYYGPVVQV